MLTTLKLVATQPYVENGEKMAWENFKHSPLCEPNKRYCILVWDGQFFIQEVIDVVEK
jgi:hypothetical protein